MLKDSLYIKVVFSNFPEIINYCQNNIWALRDCVLQLCIHFFVISGHWEVTKGKILGQDSLFTMADQRASFVASLYNSSIADWGGTDSLLLQLSICSIFSVIFPAYHQWMFSCIFIVMGYKNYGADMSIS